MILRMYDYFWNVDIRLIMKSRKEIDRESKYIGQSILAEKQILGGQNERNNYKG